MSTPKPAPTWRRWILAAVCVLLTALGLAVPAVWDWAELAPAWRMKAANVGTAAVLLSWVLALVWFFALAGFSGHTRLRGVVVLLALGGLAFGLVREVDWTGDLRPFPRWRWQPTALQQLEAPPAEGDLPPPYVEGVDLTVDIVRDFPRYRGVQGDGVVTPPELFATDWEKSPPKILWRRPCGGGFSGIAVAGDAALTLEQRRGEEVLACYDRETGAELWVHGYKAHFRDLFGDGPRATPAVHAGRVYSLGATGRLLCVSGASGEGRWAADVLGGTPPVTWGVSGSPLVVDDLGLVVVAPGGKAGPSLAAYDLRDGSRKWQADGPGGGYSSPVLATLAGRRQVVMFDAGGVAGFDVESGAELWRHPWKTFQDMNISQPVILDGGRVFVSSESSNGCAMLQVGRSGDGLAARVLWENHEMASKFSNPVAVGGALYGLNQGTLVCLDQQTGKRHWRGKRYGHGQILAAGGCIVVLSERGAVALVAADTRGFKELARFAVFNDKTWNTPALAGRRLYLRNAREIACLELPPRDGR